MRVCNKTTFFKSYNEGRNVEKIFNVVEIPPDARKGTIKQVKNVLFPTLDATLIICFHQYCTDPDLKIDGDMLGAKANYF